MIENATDRSVSFDDLLGDWPTVLETRRMGQFAKARGCALRIERDGVRVDHLVHDPRDRTTYFVTALSCSCAFFAQCGACQHHSLLLTELDWLPATTAPEIVAIECDGFIPGVTR